MVLATESETASTIFHPYGDVLETISELIYGATSVRCGQ